MENGNIENLFEEENSSEEQVSNVFADLPPVAPVDYEQQVEKETEEIRDKSNDPVNLFSFNFNTNFKTNF